MVGVVLVTHARFGEELLKSAEMILGPQEGCVALSIGVSRDMESILKSIRKSVDDTDLGKGVLILTDMFGGTPSNLSLSLLGSGKIEVVTGINLPMLLKILGSRTLPLQKLAAEAKGAGKNGILVAGEVLRRKVAEG
ncbi:MAG: PTS sugar transporter subunit IIA [Desulfovibrionales bacterium]